MSTAKKSPATRCNGDQAVEHLATGLSTDNDTRTAPQPRKPKYRPWHVHVGATDDGLPMGLCGWVSPGRDFLTSPTGPEKTDECIPRQCPDCAAIVEMQRAAVNRRDRAEKLTEFILDALDKKGL
ncbi:MAG: hypothetical protein L0K73_11995 [Corynebacterium variabile]|uniref:hypothetical protein n=1 Tax=Corynebacterium variabile TaxID=1727 RepID=UPI002647B058|nr:hypothetical protein [Corynebacterium variabile]MDN6537505.1 hypothetical protein [Corynebacterium variabile]